MTKRFFAAVIAALLIIAAAGCAPTHTVTTGIGDFELRTDTADSFKDRTPAQGNMFLTFFLTPVDPAMTIDTMSDYFRPAAEKTGPVAVVSDYEFELSFIAYDASTPPNCVLVYEIPYVERLDMDYVSLRLPS